MRVCISPLRSAETAGCTPQYRATFGRLSQPLLLLALGPWLAVTMMNVLNVGIDDAERKRPAERFEAAPFSRRVESNKKRVPISRKRRAGSKCPLPLPYCATRPQLVSHKTYRNRTAAFAVLDRVKFKIETPDLPIWETG